MIGLTLGRRVLLEDRGLSLQSLSLQACSLKSERSRELASGFVRFRLEMFCFLPSRGLLVLHLGASKADEVDARSGPEGLSQSGAA
eukprot:6464886-Amphidinium_carterae.2